MIELLLKMQEEIRDETRNKVGDRITSWNEHYNNWIDLLGPVIMDSTKRNSENSMVILRFIQLNRKIPWLLKNTIEGDYHQVIRELRFILESMIQAYYLDMEYQESDIERKLEIVKKSEKDSYGSRLINKLSINHKEEIKELYSTLSKYTHSSYKELESILRGGKVGLSVASYFDEELFNQCEVLTHRVMDVVYVIILNRFPQTKNTLEENQLLLKSLEDSQCKITLDYLRLGNK